jgi:glycosyltransferase involved in cell wall biosynthesis
MPDISLTVVGDGAMLAQFQRQATGLDVCFAGFRQNVLPFYDSADIFVMPSLGLEGLPLVSIEAMGNGLPCLFSDLPVHREISDGGRTARLFRTGDAADLKQQLCSLIADEKQREQLARAAYQRVRTLYTPEAALGSYLNAFDLTPSSTFPAPSEPQPDAVRC